MLVAVLQEAAIQHPDTDYTLLSKGFAEQMLPDLPNLHFMKQGEPIDWSHFDRIIDAHSVWRSWGIDLRARLHGKPVRRIRKGRLQKQLLTKGSQWINTHLLFRNGKTTLTTMHDRYRRLLEVGCSAQHQCNISVTSDRPRKDLGIAPFAAHKGKIYPLDKMETVVRLLNDHLSQQGEHIYLFGAGDYEKGVLESWEKKYPGVISLAGKQKMRKEIEIMAGLRLMLTMDSGNMHLASLAHTRVISIWGATHPCAGFLGYGQSPADCIQNELPCRPCSVYGNRPCRMGDYPCMDIAPETIFQRIINSL